MGRPSSPDPMVTRACQRPSLPRYRDGVVSPAATRRLPRIGELALVGDGPFQLGAFDSDGASEADHGQAVLGDLALDVAAGAARRWVATSLRVSSRVDGDSRRVVVSIPDTSHQGQP